MIVHALITNCRLERKLFSNDGNTLTMTCGRVSPITTQNAHMPPNAKANWKIDTAAFPLPPKQCSIISM